MSDIKKEKIFLNDGRKAEKIVQEQEVDGETKVVTEVWAEPKAEMKLTQRVTEHKKPVVCRRVIETVDENTGEVLEQKVESVEPDVNMQLREHIKTENSVAALSVDGDCNCYVTQEEMQKTFMDGFLAVANALKVESEKDCEPRKVTALQNVVAERVETSNQESNTKIILWGTIIVIAAAFAYVVLGM